jgi:hypothetical protein
MSVTPSRTGTSIAGLEQKREQLAQRVAGHASARDHPYDLSRAPLAAVSGRDAALVETHCDALQQGYAGRL